MKKLTILISGVLILSVSCKKENLTTSNESDSISTLIPTKTVGIRLVNGSSDETFIGNKDCETCTELITIDPTNPDGILSRVFTNESDLMSFLLADAKKYAKTIYDINFARTMRDLAITTGDINLGQEDTDQYSTQMNSLIDSYDPPSEMEGKAAGFIWDNNNLSGNMRIVTHIPTPGYGSFNNKAESYNGLGSVAFWVRTWYRGKSCVVLSTPNSTIQFTSFGMANDIESRF